jgi:protein-S-isoprenylcysteine O-methyltransferase Ste14
MDLGHFHLAANHVPVLGLPFAVLLLLAVVAWRNHQAKLFALGALVLVALAALPVYFTGEAAEEAVEGAPGIPEQLVERHEEIAGTALVVVVIVGAVALAGLVLFARTRVPVWFVALTLALSIAGGGVLAWTANTGGQIRHEQIRSAAPPPPAAHDERR